MAPGGVTPLSIHKPGNKYGGQTADTGRVREVTNCRRLPCEIVSGHWPPPIPGTGGAVTNCRRLPCKIGSGHWPLPIPGAGGAVTNCRRLPCEIVSGHWPPPIPGIGGAVTSRRRFSCEIGGGHCPPAATINSKLHPLTFLALGCIVCLALKDKEC